MNATVHRQLNRRKRRILRRIENQPGVERPEPMMAALRATVFESALTRSMARPCGAVRGTNFRGSICWLPTVATSRR